MARFASTSFAFMLKLVPAPAWYTSTTNWARCCPPSTSSAARTIASAFSAGRRPRSRLASAAAFLIVTMASTSAGQARRPLIGKLSTARAVWTPYRASAGTVKIPRESRSSRVAFVSDIIALLAACGRIIPDRAACGVHCVVGPLPQPLPHAVGEGSDSSEEREAYFVVPFFPPLPQRGGGVGGGG